MKSPAQGGPSQCMKPGLGLAVLHIVGDQERLVQEYLLGFSLRNSMLLVAFSAVRIVPIEADHPFEFQHCCLLTSYTKIATGALQVALLSLRPGESAQLADRFAQHHRGRERHIERA